MKFRKHRTLNVERPTSNPGQELTFRTGPGPAELAFGVGREFEIFGNPLAFDPEDFAAGGFGEDQLMPLGARDLLVREPILEFDGCFHTDGLEAVSGAPMTKDDVGANLVGVEKFLSAGGCWARPCVERLPVKFEPVEYGFVGCAA